MPSLSRVGDYVFFESSASGPFSIRRIEELNKTATGFVTKLEFCFVLFTTTGYDPKTLLEIV